MAMTLPLEETPASVLGEDSLFAEMIRCSPDAVILMLKGSIIVASEKAVDLLRCPAPTALLGRTALEFFDRECWPDARKRMDKLLAKGGIATPFETRLNCFDGTILEVEITESVFEHQGRKYVQAVVHDVTDRISTRQKLAQSQRRYMDIVEFSPDATVIVRGGKIIFANAIACSLYSSTSEPIEMTGRYSDDFIHRDYATINNENLLGLIAKGGAIEFFESVHIRDDGSPIYVELGGRSVPLEDGEGLLVVVRDISNRLSVQETAMVAKIEAEEANVAKSEFLANMSHELRTPLNAVIGFSQSLLAGLRGPLSPGQAEYIDDIQKSGELLLDVIGDILDISKIEAGKMSVRSEYVDVADVFAEVVLLVSHSLQGKNISVESVLDRQATHVYADKRMLKQMLLNLLSNAIKFNKLNGKVTISTWKKDLNTMLFEVADTGIGMREVDIAVAMEAFGQVAHADTRDHEGTGLGLPLVQSMVELNGGAMEIESAPGAGTIVRLSLPTVPPQMS
jgi:PAS domain S-box-containing protein